MSWKNRWRSIRTAWQGLTFTLRTEPNARIHAAVGGLVLLLAALFQIARWEWALLLVMIGMVWAAEIFNTALEVLVDYVSPDQKEFAKVCKDLSAAGVLITALTAAAVGVLIFLPPLWDWLHGLGRMLMR